VEREGEGSLHHVNIVLKVPEGHRPRKEPTGESGDSLGVFWSSV